MKSYPVYKDSGIEWIGEIPEHWEIICVKHLAKNDINVVQTGPFGAQLHSSDYIDEGIPLILIRNVNDLKIDDSDIPKVSEEDASRLSMYRLKIGDIVFSRVGSIGRVALVTEKEEGWLISGQMLRVRIHNPNLNDLYLLYSFSSNMVSESIKRESVGSTRDSINTDILRNVPLPVPLLEEQQFITTFLNHKTSQIDTLIEKKQKQIELLKEERTAIINQAVTKGLNPDVPMKDSGIEWLGEVPEHWGITKLIHITKRIGDGLHGTPEYVDDSPYYFINGNNLSNGIIKITDSTRCVSIDEFYKHEIELDENSLLMSINGTIGNVAYYMGEPIILGKSAAYINCTDLLSRNYLFYYLQSNSFVNYFSRESTGTTIFNLSLESIRNFKVTVPSLSEQLDIASYIESRTSEFNRIIDTVNHEITLMQEYRTALISNAVTGKIDLRDTATAIIE